MLIKLKIELCHWMMSVVLSLLLLQFDMGFTEPVTIIEKPVDLFPLSIIHMNDFHARYEETNTKSTSCKPEEGEICIGGYARIVHTVKQLLDTRPNPLYLNAGDNFQGTLWYNIGRWNVTSYFLNMLKADAMVLGNHEFDHGIKGVVPFLETIQSPILVANINATDEPTMLGKFEKSIIIDKYDRKIGIIGVILSTTDQIAQTGKLKFLNESDVIREEAAKLKRQGANIIIVLSHCGLDVDYEIARNVGTEIDVIVGGHSHTFMYSGDNPPGPDYPRDEYPAVVSLENGHKVLIVQASCYTKYLGNLTVYFDANGNVFSWDGAPIFMGPEIKKDDDILRKMEPWKELVDEQGHREVAVARTPLTKSGCYNGECNIGNFITAAAVNHFVGKGEDEGWWTYASMAFVAVGSIRTGLNSGSITFADLISNMPFENTLDTIELKGKHLLDMLEYSVAAPSFEGQEFSAKNMLQFSGLKVVYNVTNPIGQRAVLVEVLCSECKVPKYEPINLEKMYRIIVPSFLITGGDGFTMIPDYGVNHKVGAMDNVITEAYMKRMNPIIAVNDHRLRIVT